MSDGLVGLALLATAGLSLGACTAEEHQVNDPWAWARAMADPAPAGDAQAAELWTIQVQTFDGTDHTQRATALVTRLAREVDLPDVWFRDEGTRTVIYRGRYAAPNSQIARGDLEQTRRVTLDGKQVFSAAALVLVGAGPQAATAPQSPWDLRQFPGMYTLQIGFYDADYGKDFRAAAEEAVRVLRGDGQEAYYYHGPNRSMVCVGLFTDQDFVQDAQGAMAYGPRVRQLQEQFPYNLGNGVTLLQQRPGQKAVPQPSFLVHTSIEMR